VARTLQTTEIQARTLRAENNEERLKGTMDVKKFAGLLLALVLAVPFIATAPQGTLALVDIGLIGLLFVVRRRRLV
jgi:hypothetical protein